MAGLVGLSLSYTLPITGLLNGLLTASAETEQEMVAVERISEYCNLAPQVCSMSLRGSQSGGVEGSEAPSTHPKMSNHSHVPFLWSIFLVRSLGAGQ